MQTNHSSGSQQTAPGGTAAQANNYGVPHAFLWANTVISCLALAISICGLIMFGILYREQEREARVAGQAVDDMRASLIARGINPNNHDITDAGDNKP